MNYPTWEVTFTVYEDADHSRTTSDLQNLRQTVQCLHPQQAQALIEAQFAGRAHVWSVYQKS